MLKKIALGAVVATAMYANNFADHGSVGLKLGTLGIGAEYSYNYSDDVVARVGINGYNYKKSASESDIDYDIKLKLKTISAIVDYHPFDNAFALSAGAMVNKNKLDFNAKPSASSYNINGTTYSTAQVGTLNGEVKFKKIAPYIGIGYNPVLTKTGWSFVGELGILYQGKPKATLTTTSTNPAVRADVAKEQQQLQDSVDKFKWYPVLSVGFKYKF